ncbi:MAG: hypothetical protein GKR89_17050 [Candidatus Latescibacteria bacterium]|nr:hypothetical protein [Candidatus Latescibacterota bacterium]
MKHRFLLYSLLSFVLLLTVVVYAGRLLGRGGGWNWDVGGEAIGTLRPQTRVFLAELPGRLSITYFVSHQRHMPSDFKGIEGQVRQLLEALRRRAHHKIDIRVIDPTVSGAAGLAYAASRKASAFSVGRIVSDEQGEEKIWSSLVLAYQNHPEILIQGVGPAHLPHLEELIVQHLQALEEPPRPTFAVLAPPSFQLLGDFLGQYGRVLRLDQEAGGPLPLEADVLFVMQPEQMLPARLRQLRQFVDSGRSLIVAGSAYAVQYRVESEAETSYQIRPMPPGWNQMLQSLGLRAVPDLLLDRNIGPLPLYTREGIQRNVEAPFHLRVLPAYYNLKRFASPARGGLSFLGASPIEIETQRLAAAGWRAEIIGTTTEFARVLPLPEGAFTDADLGGGLAVPKQNLMVLLDRADPWAGQILVLASASSFQDGVINQSGYAHQVFLRTLVRSWASPQVLVRNRVERPRPQALPSLDRASRLVWRALGVFLVPAGLVLAVLVGLVRRGGLVLPPSSGWLARRGGLALLVAVGAVLAGHIGWYADWTATGHHTPDPLTRRTLAELTGDLAAELVIAPKAALPRPLKGVEAGIGDLLEHSDIVHHTVRPGHLSTDRLQGLQREGLVPFEVERVIDDSLTSQRVWSGLRLQRGDQVVTIGRLDERTAVDAEFLLVAALKRLDSGAAPHVAVISDLPRLSPAEALEDFHKKSLIPPGGVDVYGQLKGLLTAYGYRVSHINPRQPHLPPQTDILLWLQPRRDSSRMTQLLSQHLAAGGRALVAMQHFNIQQRQYRGAGFETVYWPQPQFQDLDPYLRLVGVEQVREVLMDRTQSHLQLDTQINRTGRREYEAQQVALPFLIRAVGGNYAKSTDITSRLGDLQFIWGNRFAVDDSVLTAAGLRARTLISTSDRAWSFAWQGGWLPPEVLAPTQLLPGPQALALRLDGPFPRIELAEDEKGRQQFIPDPVPPRAKEGTLVLVGCSEMFKNDYLYASGFAHDRLLLNAVAQLAYGTEMAALQARHPAPRGFAFRSPQVKAYWRLFAVGAGPLAVLLVGVYCYAQRRRPLRWT